LIPDDWEDPIHSTADMISEFTGTASNAYTSGRVLRQMDAAIPNSTPVDWPSRSADNGRGTVWQQPGAVGNANMVRVMEPTSRYPNGYVRFYNRHGQPVTMGGRPGSRAETHVPIGPDGSYPTPDGWPS